MTGWIERQDFSLTPLSPIHLGTGSDIDWTTSFIDGDDVVLFDPFRTEFSAKSLEELNKLIALPDAGQALLGLQRFYQREKAALVPARTEKIAVLRGLAKEMAASVGKVSQREASSIVVNNLMIARTAFNAVRSELYIPGSSVKGALRTAWLDSLAPITRGVALDEQEMLGGKFERDPFRLLMVEDLTAADRACATIVLATNYRRTSPKPGRAVEVRVETITPFVPGAFSGALRRRDLQGRATGRAPEGGPVLGPLAEIMARCSNFHIGLFRSHFEEMRGLGAVVDGDWLSGMERLIHEMRPRFEAGSAALVRLGKFGTAESKRVSARSIQVKTGRQTYEARPRGTTFWLARDAHAESGLPLGWAILEFQSEPSSWLSEWCQAQVERSAYRPRPQIAVIPQSQFAGRAESSAPTASKLVMVTATPAQQLMAVLESDLDKTPTDETFGLGAGIGQSVRTLVNAAMKGWQPDDRKLLARLIDEKVRQRLRIHPHEQKDFESKVTWLKK